MPRTTQNPKADTLNLRIDPSLKAEFFALSETKNMPVAEILRELDSRLLLYTKQFG